MTVNGSRMKQTVLAGGGVLARLRAGQGPSGTSIVLQEEEMRAMTGDCTEPFYKPFHPGQI